MGMVGFYYLLIGVMAIWMAIKVGRESLGMGIATFLFWPIAIIPLITNWGQRGSDIRLQFLVASVATVLLMNASVNLVANNVALTYSPEDIDQIRAQDPVFAAEIEREQLRAFGVEIVPAEADSRASGATSTFASLSVEPRGARGAAPTATVAPAATEAEMKFSAAPAQVHKVPLRELNFRRGQVRLGPAYAYLTVPEHFRFVAVHQLGLLSEIRGIAVDDRTLGWIVHERVDLRSPRFWFVDVQFHDSGHLAAPTGDTPAATEMRWDAEQALAGFTRAAEIGEGQDQVAARLLRHGAVVFRVPQLSSDELELGLRAARLMASRTKADSGWSHADFTGVQSPQTLPQWVASLQAGENPAVVAESEENSGIDSLHRADSKQ